MEQKERFSDRASLRNSLAIKAPSIAAEWHPTKNHPLQPTQITVANAKKVWWLGKCGHEWIATVLSRTSNGTGCPYCAGKKALAGFNDFQTVRPTLAEEWHPTMNHPLQPTQVTAGSAQKVWWLGKCGHEWEASVVSRSSNGTGCPYCTGRKALAGVNDLQTVRPTLAEEWHPTKNHPLQPSQVKVGSNRKVWWLGKCGHEWETRVANRTYNESGCPYCAGRKVLMGFNDLQTSHPTLATEWHPTKNHPLQPTQVHSQSDKRVWWLGKCGHEWEATIMNRAYMKHGCPICKKNRTRNPE